MPSLAKHKTHVLTRGREPHLHQDVGEVFVFGMAAEGSVQFLDEPRAVLGVPHGKMVCEGDDLETTRASLRGAERMRTPRYIQMTKNRKA